ncbi:hypothetical protein HN512_02380 [Candidatus Peregrinibacteria bacterium]|jgi:hypothetical protein|nr:hypothetical protein [Candidatus Peregrinibacteria bacterium]MBT4585926.1 hypothetical protein [Candidatus Peregrinibacteria bacterium]MBT6730941.1 hypothetical protein [Candidatus Peregrinibacteria bacterium]MBT7008943.1 hypothetical protein [Candidatus Peregrinibacteria bacterium]
MDKLLPGVLLVIFLVLCPFVGENFGGTAGLCFGLCTAFPAACWLFHAIAEPGFWKKAS